MKKYNKDKKEIPAWKAYLYSEVFIVTEYRDGCVFKTTPSGFFILNEEISLLKGDFVTSSISTKLCQQDIIKLDVRPAEFFNQGI